MWTHDLYDDSIRMKRTGGFDVNFKQVTKDRYRLRAIEDIRPLEVIRPPMNAPFDRSRYSSRTKASLVDEIEARYKAQRMVYDSLKAKIDKDALQSEEYIAAIHVAKRCMISLKEELVIMRKELFDSQILLISSCEINQDEEIAALKKELEDSRGHLAVMQDDIKYYQKCMTGMREQIVEQQEQIVEHHEQFVYQIEQFQEQVCKLKDKSIERRAIYEHAKKNI